MVTLYHFAGAICPQKVRIALCEKQVEWKSEIVTDLRSPEYLRLNPAGYVPTLVHDDRILRESRLISEYIEDAFHGPALLPEDSYRRYTSRLWSKQVDDSLHIQIFVLSFAAIFSHHLRRAGEEERERRMPLDPFKRFLAAEILRDSYDSQWVDHAIRRFALLADDMDRALQQQEWLTGDSYTLADCDLTPYVLRLKMLGLETLLIDRPALSAWVERVESRPSYKTGLLDWVSEQEASGYRAGAEGLSPAIARALAA
jgi:glutathione S-transferase